MPPDSSEDLRPITPARGLVDAIGVVGADLDLPRVLQRLVRAACDLTGACYGALGVLSSDHGRIEQFITHGISDEERAALETPPVGLGVLGVLIHDPRPVRLGRLQDHPASVGFPPNHPCMEAFLGVPLLVGDSVYGNLYLCDKHDGGTFTEQDEEFLSVLATGAARVIDNALTYERSEQRRIWLESVARIGDLLQGPGDIAASLGQMAISARRLAAAGGAAIVRLIEDQPTVLAVDGPRSDFLNALMPALTDHLRGVVGTRGTHREATFGINRILVLPLREHFAEGGAVVLVADEPFASAATGLVSSFLDQAALALDRVHALGQREELLLTADRERIARDLHDVVIQRLFATGLQLQATRRSALTADVADRIDQATESLDTTIRDIRATIFNLQRTQAQSLRGDLQAIIEEYVEPLGHQPLLRTSGPVDSGVGAQLEEQLTIVLREALSNVARHAQATSTTVELTLQDGRVCLAVTDDGVGFQEQRVESGLKNLRERAAQLGGAVEFDRGSHGGTQMRWEVPVT